MKTMKQLFTMISAILVSSSGFSQNGLLSNPVVNGSLPAGTNIVDIEFVTNGADVALVAADGQAGKFYVIDIGDNNAADLQANEITQIPSFSASLGAALGQSSATITALEANPITHSVYALVQVGGASQIVRMTGGSAAPSFTLIDQSNLTYSEITWGSGSIDYQDMTWGDNTLYITSGGNWALDGEIATVSAPFVHGSTTSNRSTSMFKTNWGGGYHTDAPLEKIAFGAVQGTNRLMGVTLCAPGYSIESSLINGSGLLQVEEVFNVNFDPPVKVVHQFQNGKHYLFDLHAGWPSGTTLIRIGEDFIDGSPISSNQFNSSAQYIRTGAGAVTPGMSEDQVKVYTEAPELIAAWDNCNLLVLSGSELKLLQTAVTPDCPQTTTALKEETVENSISVYPTVASSTLTVACEDCQMLEGTLVEIFTLTGKLVETIPVQGTSAQFNIQNVANGTYMVKVVSEEWVSPTTKIIVAR